MVKTAVVRSVVTAFAPLLVAALAHANQQDGQLALRGTVPTTVVTEPDNRASGNRDTVTQPALNTYKISAWGSAVRLTIMEASSSRSPASEALQLKTVIVKPNESFVVKGKREPTRIIVTAP